MGWIVLEDMERSGDRGNEYYTGRLPSNGDIVQFSKYGYYGDDRPWEWQVYVPEDYPIQCYDRIRRGHRPATVEECLLDFEQFYEGRAWRSIAEQRLVEQPSYVRCLACGWEGDVREVGSATVYEDYGDVECRQCPACGTVELDGDVLFDGR